jgi:hypothetical protein
MARPNLLAAPVTSTTGEEGNESATDMNDNPRDE